MNEVVSIEKALETLKDKVSYSLDKHVKVEVNEDGSYSLLLTLKEQFKIGLIIAGLTQGYFKSKWLLLGKNATLKYKHHSNYFQKLEKHTEAIIDIFINLNERDNLEFRFNCSEELLLKSMNVGFSSIYNYIACEYRNIIYALNNQVKYSKKACTWQDKHLYIFDCSFSNILYISSLFTNSHGDLRKTGKFTITVPLKQISEYNWNSHKEFIFSKFEEYINFYFNEFNIRKVEIKLPEESFGNHEWEFTIVSSNVMNCYITALEKIAKLVGAYYCLTSTGYKETSHLLENAHIRGNNSNLIEVVKTNETRRKG